MALFCECSMLHGAVGLIGAGESPIDDEYVWVCIDCQKPSYPIYERYMAECDECGRTYSSPFESLCAVCTRNGSPERAARDEYHGWTWAIQVNEEYFQKMSSEALTGLV